MYQVKQVENYCTNVDEIIELAEKYSDLFSSRTESDTYEFKTKYGVSHMKSMFGFKMPTDLQDAVWRTVPDDRRFAHSVTLNKYEPGDYLPRHKDSIGSYWKFKLVFLRSDEPHFKWYDEDNVGHYVDEIPGAYLDMPITLEHEVTKIKQHERPKYSLVFAWGE